MAEFLTFVVRDSDTIRDSILRTRRAGLIKRGIETPNVTPGSDDYVEAQAIANQLAVTEANGAIMADRILGDTATGDDLVRTCAMFGLQKQGAAGSVGPVTIASSAITTVASGDQLLDGAGQAYEVITGGIVPINGTIAIRAIATGKATNLEPGSVLRWVSSPPFCDEKVVVAGQGLVNGTDEEDDETLRGRLFARWQEPPTSGNAQDVAESAEKASPSVQKAFVYPAALGPSTYAVAVAAAPTATSKSRDVAPSIVNGTVAPYVTGKYPEHAHAVITTVENVDADVAFGIAIPEAPTASPPGAGGGWLDGTPWPAPDASTTWRCTVTGVTSTTVFTVDAMTAPSVGVSHVAWISPFDWKLYTAVVIGVAGTAGAYVITLDQPFVGIAVGCYLFPEAENTVAYKDAALAAFALMGPGEKTANVSLIVRGYRRPRSAAGWPMTLGGHLTQAITDARDEVASTTFLHRTDGTSTVTGPGGLVTPQIPATLNDAPKIFRPRHIAFYRVPQ